MKFWPTINAGTKVHLVRNFNKTWRFFFEILNRKQVLTTMADRIPKPYFDSGKKFKKVENWKKI